MQAVSGHEALPPPPPRLVQPLRGRDRILAAARILLRDSSYLGFSMDALARSCDLSRQTLYNHFSDRDAVYRASRSQLLESFGDDLPRQVAPFAMPALAVELFIARALEALARPEHVELSRSAIVDRAACPWIATYYRDRVERPLATGIERYVRSLGARSARDGAGDHACDLVTKMRAVTGARDRVPLLSASELASLFLARIHHQPGAMAWVGEAA